jgi:predicted enzyme related to lactoylglutathione lyase
MTHVDKHTGGSFCWIELATTDQKAAKNFYGSLFGWTPQDSPIGPNEVYTLFKVDGRDAAAGYTLRAEQRANGVPPNWIIYITVDGADQAAAKSKELGGTVVMAPFDVMDLGRMAVLTDPTGAHFCVWQAAKNSGIGISGVPGTLCWADLSTPDVKRASDFYSKLFGWQIAAGENDKSGYLHIKNGEHFIGGVPPSQYRQPGVPPHWLAYFWVDDVDAVAAKAKGAGAKMCLEPTTIENVGRMAVIADPQGAVFAIFNSPKR